MGDPPQPTEISPARAAGLALLAFVVGAFLALAFVRLDRATTSFPETPREPQAAIGGPFHLLGPTGRRVTESNFRGKFMLLTFGYTRSPDLTPATLQLMTAATDGLTPAASAKLTPVFVTLDPEHDDREALASYLARFSTHFVGLTGTPEEIAETARAWKLPVERLQRPDGSTDIEYPAYIYLMAPDGTYVTHFSLAASLDEVRSRLQRELQPRSRL